jgi:CBS domain-containing protein
MLRAIIGDAIQAQADMTVVGSYGTCAELAAAASSVSADVAVMGMSRHPLSPACDDAMFALHNTRCLAITDDGRDSYLYELRPHREPVGALSMGDLLSVIRGRDPRRSP